MRVIQAIGCALAILLSANTAQARSGNTYQSSLSGSSYAASATWQGSATPLSGGDLAQSAQMSSLIGTAQGYYQGIQWALNDAVRAAVAQSGDVSVRMKYPSGVLRGTLNASLSGLQGGNIRFRLDGLRYDVVLQANGRSGPVSFECNVSLTIGSIVATLDYNPYTGAISGANVSFEPSQTTGCDNSLGWVPWLGDYINGKLAGAAGQIALATGSFSGRVLDIAPQQALFGFVNAIQPNTYLYGGVDVGMYLKNNIQTLYVNKQVRLSVADPASFYVPSLNHVPSPSLRSGKALGIEFLDSGVSQVGFQINLTRSFNWVLIEGEE
ncbi:hypothetical protein H5407_19310 [Mitsuaria sp. WAJ17]|uniref:hypothetical protein n=1 Tax=Mitsuaria sp. WAJ17 TaxID=2761452 RepID=UPI0015FED712|nr:hypothetical protein [Mitsuaria sp. WAJ17]MBB2487390.1 hypothetical protein [Mitsuaria sp. WAJ17]